AGGGSAPPNELEHSNEKGDTSKPEGPTEAKSNVSTPKSISVSLPPPEIPSPTTHPLPSASPPVSKQSDSPESTKGFRPRQDSVASASSIYSPSVYTTTSNLGGPDKDVHGPAARFYVGRSSWEERAWLEL
ncbi:6081_t:CDS:1, partial [Acaulospora colombiana]